MSLDAEGFGVAGLLWTLSLKGLLKLDFSDVMFLERTLGEFGMREAILHDPELSNPNLRTYFAAFVRWRADAYGAIQPPLPSTDVERLCKHFVLGAATFVETHLKEQQRQSAALHAPSSQQASCTSQTRLSRTPVHKSPASTHLTTTAKAVPQPHPRLTETPMSTPPTVAYPITAPVSRPPSYPAQTPGIATAQSITPLIAQSLQPGLRHLKRPRTVSEVPSPAHLQGTQPPLRDDNLPTKRFRSAHWGSGSQVGMA